MSSLLVASHNIMHGIQRSALVRHYAELDEHCGLDVLCLQENGTRDGVTHAEHFSAGLGGRLTVLSDDRCPSLAILLREGMRLVDQFVIDLPRLGKLRTVERLFIAAGQVEQKYAFGAVIESPGHEPIAVVSFHLDTAGANEHRCKQVTALAHVLLDLGFGQRFVVCGDTNAFTFWTHRNRAIMTQVMAPIEALGAPLHEQKAPTHFFARQQEKLLPHRTCAFVGKLGLDHPLRYDVVLSCMPVTERGQVTTPESDHDLVWARVELT